MKIYFTCSTAEFLKHKKTYYAIRNFLIEEKHLLTRDWLEKTEKRIESGKFETFDIKKIYKECVKAINEADLVIVEDTVSNFSTGHQITLALQKHKAVLVLWKGEKHKHFKQMFIHGIDSDKLEVSQYTTQNYKEIIKAFICKYSNFDQQNRFHLVLNNYERTYLDWAQYNNNISRTRIIKNSLKKSIEEDERYKEYLDQNNKI